MSVDCTNQKNQISNLICLVGTVDAHFDKIRPELNLNLFTRVSDLESTQFSKT